METTIRTQRAQLLGVTRGKGTLDDGTAYDFTKVYVLMPFDPTSGNQLGATAVEMRYGKSANFGQFEGKRFPLAVELDLLDVASKQGMRTVIQAVRPLAPAAKVA